MSVSSNLVLIETLQSKQIVDLAAVTANASDILVAQSDISDSQSAIVVNAAGVNGNRSDLSDASGRITANDSDISTNLASITALGFSTAEIASINALLETGEGFLTPEELATVRSLTNLRRATATATPTKANS